jgi:hypothetical protein
MDHKTAAPALITKLSEGSRNYPESKFTKQDDDALLNPRQLPARVNGSVARQKEILIAASRNEMGEQVRWERRSAGASAY